MAYSTKYFSRIADSSGNTYTVNLKKQNYSGDDIEITDYSLSPLTLNYRGGRDDIDTTIFPSSVNFNFYSKSTDDFSDLIEAEYKTWQLEIQRTNYTSPTYDLLFSTGSTDTNQDGSGQTWSLTGSTAKVSLSNTNSTSKFLYVPVDNLTDFKVVVNDMFSDGSLIPNLRIQFLDSGGTVQYTKTTPLFVKGSTTSSAYSATYTGLTPITRVQIYCYVLTLFPGSALVEWQSTGMDVYQGNSTNLLWLGWVDPSTMTTKFLSDQYFINLEANDGLLDLKEIEYPSQGASGYTKQINVIKTAILQTGLELDISSQLNLTESHIDGPVLSSIYSDTRRFIDTADGRPKYDNCLDTLEKEINIYNTRFAQVNGKWTLTSQDEISSNILIYDFDTLDYITQSLNRELNISNYKVFFESDELSKINPIKVAEITLNNRNIGDSVITNGTFSDGTNGFNNGEGDEAWTTFQTLDDQLFAGNLSGGVPGQDYSFSTTTFNIDQVGENNTLVVSIDAKLNSIEFEEGLPLMPNVEIELTYPDESVATTSSVGGNTFSLVLGTYKHMTHTFTIDQDGDYFLTVKVKQQGLVEYTSLTMLFDNFTAVQRFDDNVEITFDKFTQTINTGTTAVQRFQKTIHFGDSLATGDISMLKYSPTGFTSSWSTHDEALVDAPLTHVLAYNILRSRQRFKDYLRINIKADSRINFNSILNIKGTKYAIFGMSHDLLNMRCELDLVEVLTNSIGTSSYSEYILNTVDGKSTGGGGSGGSVEISGVSEAEYDIFVSSTNSSISDIEDRLDINETDIDDLESEISTHTSGTFTPTTYHDSNVSSSTAYVSNYLRIGNVVHVTGMVDVTMGATTATLGMSVPIALTYSAVEQAAGVANGNTSTLNYGYIQASGANGGRVQLFLNGALGAKRFFFTYSYRLS